jgi:hypothetical protein
MKILKILTISFFLTAIVLFATINEWCVKNIYVTYKVNATKDLTYQVFYTDTADGNFNEPQSAKQVVPVGVQVVKIILPTQKIAKFRLDFGVEPETVYIADLKLVGDKIIKFDDFSNFAYYHIDEYTTVTEDNALKIVSNQRDPYMIYKENLDVTPGTDINWFKSLQIAFGTFFIAFILGLFLTRKKAEKPIQGTNPKTRSKK